MNNRETNTLTAPSGKTFTIKSFFTARERNALRNVYLHGMKIDMSLGTSSIKELDGSILEAAEKKLLELAIVSFDNNSENIIDRILDGNAPDYDFIVAEAGKLNSSLTEAK